MRVLPLYQRAHTCVAHKGSMSWSIPLVFDFLSVIFGYIKPEFPLLSTYFNLYVLNK